MSKKTNVLIILSDQQRFDTIHEAGYEQMITPSLDRLAKEGCLFTNAYSSNPVCMPARHDLLMGMPSGAHGFFANCNGRVIKDYGVPTLPRLFTEQGYRTAAIGKMHFSPTRMHHGYSEMHLMEELPKCRQNDAYASFLKEKGYEQIENIHGVRPLIYHEVQQAQVEDSLYETKWISQRTIQWLENNQKQPFMLCVGYIKPHPPWDVPSKYQELYKNQEVPAPIPRSRLYPYETEKDPWYGDEDSLEQQKNIRRAYYASVTAVDESVGEILDYLRQTGEIDNTLIIYTSDHGEMLQDKGFYSKEIPYESAAHIPFIIRYPKEFEGGKRDERLIDLTDILPTCLSAAHIDYPNGQYRPYGTSLLTSDLKDDKNREYVISASGFLGDKRFVMCRNRRYKYIYRYNMGTEEMYDLVEDATEQFNCIEKMKSTEVYHRLKAQVIAYETKWGPEGAVKEGDLTLIEGSKFDASMGGKYHLWANHQFQNFTELVGEERLKQFDKELEKALESNPDASLFEVKEWIEDYKKERQEYRQGKPMNV